MSDGRGSVAQRFQALPRLEDDSDRQDVLLRAASIRASVADAAASAGR